jgi:hypothetical protein
MSAASVNGRAVPEPGRALAARLSGLFMRDVEIVERLNDAQRRLREAIERLWSGLSADAFGLVYDGAAPAGTSRIVALGARGSQTELLGALQERSAGRSTAGSARIGTRARSGASSRSRSVSSRRS